jgi:hypothetical protein
MRKLKRQDVFGRERSREGRPRLGLEKIFW